MTAQVAIFLDFENVAQSAESVGDGGSPSSSPSRYNGTRTSKTLQIERIIDYAAIQGNISIRRAYADWMSPTYLKHQKSLLENGFELVYLPRTSSQGKNGSDVRLAVDVMELLFLQPSISTFILGTGDTDFIPLLQKIRAYNKKVIILGFEHSVGRLVKANTNEFRALEDILSLRIADRASKSETKTMQDQTAIANDGKGLLLRFLRNFSEQTVLMSDLKLQLLRLDSAFSESKYGFSSFKSFVESFVPELFSGLVRHEGGHWSAVINYSYSENSQNDSKDLSPLELEVKVDRKEPVKESLSKIVTCALRNMGNSSSMKDLELEVRKSYPQFTPQNFGFSSFLELLRSLSPETVMVWEPSASTSDASNSPNVTVRLSSKSPRASKVSKSYAEASRLLKQLKVSVAFDERLRFCSAVLLKFQTSTCSMRELRTHLIQKFGCTASSARKFIGTLFSAGVFIRADLAGPGNLITNEMEDGAESSAEDDESQQDVLHNLRPGIREADEIVQIYEDRIKLIVMTKVPTLQDQEFNHLMDLPTRKSFKDKMSNISEVVNLKETEDMDSKDLQDETPSLAFADAQKLLGSMLALQFPEDRRIFCKSIWELYSNKLGGLELNFVLLSLQRELNQPEEKVKRFLILLCRAGCFQQVSSDRANFVILHIETDVLDDEVKLFTLPVTLATHIQDADDLAKRYLSRLNAIVVSKIDQLKQWEAKLLLHFPKDDLEQSEGLTSEESVRLSDMTRSSIKEESNEV
jgi:uncharacterized protein (TIGR00288 family)